MNHFKEAALVILLAAHAAPVACASAAAPDAEITAQTVRQFDDELFAAMHNPELQAMEEGSAGPLDRIFRKFFDGADFFSLGASLPAEGALNLQSAMFNLSLYARSAEYRPQMEAVAEALFNREENRALAVQTLHHYYLTFRAFDAARELRERFAELSISAPPSILPASIQPSAASRPVFALEKSDRALIFDTVDLDNGSKLVIVSHPGCNFSKQAWRAILDNPEIAQLVEAHAIVVASPYTRLDSTLFSDWSFASPKTPVFIAYNYEGWPEITDWSTPVFYFFDGGDVKHRVVGWPNGSDAQSLSALRDGFQSIGVLPMLDD